MSEAQTIQLVVGLGNPGAGYAEDRHNAGFWLLDGLARRWSVALREEARFKAVAGRARCGVRLLKPLTFMNLAGESVAGYAGYFRIPAPAILVVHDELDLPAGVLRLKRGGGHGGHNGLRSIETNLGSKAFLRLRLGIGHPGARHAVTAHVLGRPSPDERQSIMAAIDLALEHIEDIVGGGFDRVMNVLNRRAPPDAGGE